jgi:hypothetical protein
MKSAADWATVATAVIALLALGVAIIQIKSTNKISRESAATKLYDESLKLCLEFPKFANPDHNTFSADEYRSYRWFVASLLLSAEQILEVTKGDRAWRNSVKATLRRHSRYLASRLDGTETKLEDFYEEKLLPVIAEIISERGQPSGSYLTVTRRAWWCL